jgi:hypothetical protein
LDNPLYLDGSYWTATDTLFRAGHVLFKCGFDLSKVTFRVPWVFLLDAIHDNSSALKVSNVDGNTRFTFQYPTGLSKIEVHAPRIPIAYAVVDSKVAMEISLNGGMIG